jgi:hypothetical protein
MPPPCGHAPPEPGCSLCALAGRDPRYRALWGGPAAAPAPCRHLGAPTGETAACPSCRGRVGLKLFACATHGRCTRGTAAPGVACCEGCPDREAGPEVTVRHLAYHVYAVKGNGVWQANVRHLLRRIDLFNGHRVIAVATDGRTDTLAAVRAAFAGHAHEFLEVRNDPALREVATFEPLFERLETTNPGHCLAYLHAKGVTRPPGHAAHLWAEVQYEVMLDRWPLVAGQLQRFPVTGPFRKLGRGWPDRESRADWHYSGSAYWLRCRDLFSRDWRRIDRCWTGIEPYPALHFRAEEAGCLFHPGRVPTMNLYDAGYWRDVVLPDLGRWRGGDHAHAGA